MIVQREVVSCKVKATKLRKAMKAAGLTHEETARRSGKMSLRQLTRIMAMEHCPSLERAFALSIVLGMSMFDLFEIKLEVKPAKGGKGVGHKKL